MGLKSNGKSVGDFVQVRCSKVTERNEDIFRLRKLSTGMQIKANRVKKNGRATSVCKKIDSICMIEDKVKK